VGAVGAVDPMKRIAALLVPVLLICSFLPATAQAWWNADWKYRRKILLNTTPAGADVKESVGPVPVAVRLHSGNFLFTDARSDGSDIRFVASDDKTPLRYHIERYDSTNQLAMIWIQLPQIGGGSSTEYFWLYSGNDKITTPGDDPKGVYDPPQLLALEFGEAQPPFKDSSAYANPVADDGVNADVSGIFAGAGAFSGQPLKVAAVPAARIGTGGSFTFSGWFRPAGVQKAKLFVWGPLSVEQDGDKIAVVIGKTTVSGGALKAGEWSQVGVTVSDKVVVYVNGAEAASGAGSLPELAGEMTIGDGYSGLIDSLGVASVARPAAWFKLTAADGADVKLIAFGEAEAGEDAGSSYIKILFSSLTVDAKVVIGILGLMFLIAIAVMGSKAVQVSRTENHNAEFLESFSERPREFLNPSSDTSRAVGNGALLHSSLVRLYQTGMRELRLRLSDQRTDLSAESVAAIKASIDSTLIRENQRLNQRMVLLTIAISGGPFLGLLGTVVGVMITFASIAAQGDVNINAIAPGIAAALLATVAGLAVAIPSLFGYNYLITRIKSISADMQAFSDEFICKLAEAHNQ
jgi:biopolymer transport protein ExbB